MSEASSALSAPLWPMPAWQSRVSPERTPENLPWETRSRAAVQAPLMRQQPQSYSAGGAPRCLNTSAPMPAYHGPTLPPEYVFRESAPPEPRCALAWPHVSKSRSRSATMLLASAADTRRRARSGQDFAHSGARLQSLCPHQEKSELSLPNPLARVAAPDDLPKRQPQGVPAGAFASRCTECIRSSRAAYLVYLVCLACGAGASAAPLQASAT